MSLGRFPIETYVNVAGNKGNKYSNLSNLVQHAEDKFVKGIQISETLQAMKQKKERRDAIANTLNNPKVQQMFAERGEEMGIPGGMLMQNYKYNPEGTTNLMKMTDAATERKQLKARAEQFMMSGGAEKMARDLQMPIEAIAGIVQEPGGFSKLGTMKATMIKEKMRADRPYKPLRDYSVQELQSSVDLWQQRKESAINYQLPWTPEDEATLQNYLDALSRAQKIGKPKPKGKPTIEEILGGDAE